MIDTYMSAAKVTELLSLSKNDLAKMRCDGSGPVFFRIGRRVRYRCADIQAWLDARRRTSTAAMPET